MLAYIDALVGDGCGGPQNKGAIYRAGKERPALGPEEEREAMNWKGGAKGPEILAKVQ